VAISLLAHLFIKAGVDIKGHDLRRTYATLARKAGQDESLAMRVIRDIMPGQTVVVSITR
jgi:integrase